MRAFCGRVCASKNIHFQTSTYFIEPPEGIFLHARKIIFPSEERYFTESYLPTDLNYWKEFDFERVRHFLSDFFVNYRMSNGERVSPETMLNYINIIQRAFRHDCKYDFSLIKGPVFVCPDQGLVTIMENVLRGQQAKGQTLKSRDVLNADDLTNLYKSE